MSTTGSSQQLLTIEEDRFAQCFSSQAFAVGHELADHPLLTLDAMAELADRLPLKSIERHRADLPLLSPGQPPELEGPPSETVRQLESGNAWMVMWYIEQVPEYRVLLDECLDQVETYVGERHGGMRYRKAYLFLSAPGATTPAHFDPEQNLLLQIRGAKDFSVGRFAYPTEQQAELDRYFDGGHRNLNRMPQLETTFQWSRAMAGTCLRSRLTGCTWVEASISLSITFRTRSSLEMERVSHFNARMRRLHLSPQPPGTSRARDRLKASMIETLTALRRHNGDAAHGDRAGLAAHRRPKAARGREPAVIDAVDRRRALQAQPEARLHECRARSQLAADAARKPDQTMHRLDAIGELELIPLAAAEELDPSSALALTRPRSRPAY